MPHAPLHTDENVEALLQATASGTPFYNEGYYHTAVGPNKFVYGPQNADGSAATGGIQYGPGWIASEQGEVYAGGYTSPANTSYPTPTYSPPNPQYYDPASGTSSHKKRSHDDDDDDMPRQAAAMYNASGGNTSTSIGDRVRSEMDGGRARETARGMGSGSIAGVSTTTIFIVIAALAALLILRK